MAHRPPVNAAAPSAHARVSPTAWRRRETIVAAALAVAALGAPAALPGQPHRASADAAELPRAYVDVRMPQTTGRTIRVPAGGNLQAAIDGARPGDEIVLAAGATYRGPVRLRRKRGDDWIVIRSSGRLPTPGTRVTPADAPQLATVVTTHPSEPALATEHGAHHYRLVGLELATAPTVASVGTLVALGDGGPEQDAAAEVAHHLVLDRVYVHGGPTTAVQRCIGLNSGETAIVDSWITGCHLKGGESQAIAGWNGPGPFRITNNHIAGAGINVMFGGDDPKLRGTVPSDIEIRRNHIVKPLSWKGVWTAKNLFELKSAQRVLVEGNVLENSWVDGQIGFAVVLWSVNPYGGCTWCGTRDVTIRYNEVRNAAGGFQLTRQAEHPVVPMQRVTIAHNLLTGIGHPDLGTNGRMYQIGGAIESLVIANNTGLSPHHGIIFAEPPRPMPGFVVRDNIMLGSIHSSDGAGARAWELYAGPGSHLSGNVLVGMSGTQLPQGNTNPGHEADVGFINPRAGDYRVRSTSRYRGAGVDVAALRARTSGVEQGTPVAPASP